MAVVGRCRRLKTSVVGLFRSTINNTFNKNCNISSTNMWCRLKQMCHCQEPMMTSAIPQSIIGSLGWWTISFLPPFEGNNDIPVWKTRIKMGNEKIPVNEKILLEGHQHEYLIVFSLTVKNLLTISLKIFEFWIKIKDSNQREWKNPREERKNLSEWKNPARWKTPWEFNNVWG